MEAVHGVSDPRSFRCMKNSVRVTYMLNNLEMIEELGPFASGELVYNYIRRYLLGSDFV